MFAWFLIASIKYGINLVIGAILYACVVIITGLIKFNSNIKKRIFLLYSIIYNALFGFFINGYVIILCLNGILNFKKAISNIGLVLKIASIVLVIYCVLLIPTNLYMKKQSSTKWKTYIVKNIIATLLGSLAYGMIVYIK